jgi:uncharacterized GH25 family protein
MNLLSLSWRIPMKTARAWRFALVAICLAAAVPQAAQAHRAWLLPSATVLSGDDVWVTVDAAISNELFYFEHHPMRLDGLQVFGPDQQPVTPEHPNTGRYRSTFDIRLAKTGTYRIAVTNDIVLASYQAANGEAKRLRGTVESIRKELPADAQAVRVTHNQSRIEAFVTAGRPTDEVLQPAGTGLELQPVTHPNDLFVGDTARFRFLLDGKPAAGIEVGVIPGGIRYRDQLGEMKLTTDDEGIVNVDWPGPGMYWLSASHGGGRGEAQPGGTFEKPARRTSYGATLEVLPQ